MTRSGVVKHRLDNLDWQDDIFHEHTYTAGYIEGLNENKKHVKQEVEAEVEAEIDKKNKKILEQQKLIEGLKYKEEYIKRLEKTLKHREKTLDKKQNELSQRETHFVNLQQKKFNTLFNELIITIDFDKLMHKLSQETFSLNMLHAINDNLNNIKNLVEREIFKRST